MCTQDIKNKIPCQAVCNKLQVYVFPKDFICICWPKKVLIARRRLQFKKIAMMLRWQAPKLNMQYVMFQ